MSAVTFPSCHRGGMHGASLGSILGSFAVAACVQYTPERVKTILEKAKTVYAEIKEFMNTYTIVSEPLKILARGAVLYGAFSLFPWTTSLGFGAWALYQIYITPDRVLPD